MKNQSPSEPGPMDDKGSIFDDHNSWANKWHPTWDSAKDQPNSGKNVQEDSADDSSAANSPWTASTPSEDQRD
jgi:hypothetical protein